MYFVSGSIAAYLYYNAVEKREGRKFDIDGSPRHAKAKEAIEKWGERGWMFAEKDGRKKKSHAALDCKVVSLQTVIVQHCKKMEERNFLCGRGIFRGL